MKRRSFSLAAGVSLVLCLATALFWIRSTWHSDWISYHWPVESAVSQRNWFIESDRGIVRLSWMKKQVSPLLGEWDWAPPGVDAGTGLSLEVLHSGMADLGIGSFGFGFSDFGSDTYVVRGMPLWTTARYMVVVPHAALVALFAALPGVWLWRWKRCISRVRVNLCTASGCDLRATPDRCPECGSEVARASSP